ncbi:MAG: hypothetical protein LBO04_08160 [Spirochaetaceae bacterium]|jgi:hypothetical protein|nr:hypothetical protein [Spirochaetaceae bacterium]
MTIPAVDVSFKNRLAQERVMSRSDRGVKYCAEALFKTLKMEPEILDGGHSEAEVRKSVFIYL